MEAISQFRWCEKKLYEGEGLARSGKNTQQCLRALTETEVLTYLGLVLHMCVGKYCMNSLGPRPSGRSCGWITSPLRVSRV